MNSYTISRRRVVIYVPGLGQGESFFNKAIDKIALGHQDKHI